ncbi:hypothetical protein P7K49_013209 [Saguinus oedipus]|uniref:Uncharacterized protein n=1 Tax=Saguinus oedipus TaxID=9490 RepID=A0ABQ9VFA2_SAGOE|nr:hypothetical protein P7K49_013209 [Saguinus oedipus]
MATAMYLEHYLDSKRAPWAPRPPPARSTLCCNPPSRQAPHADPVGSGGRRLRPAETRSARTGRGRPRWGEEGAGGGLRGSRRLGRANSRCVTAGRDRTAWGGACGLGPAPYRPRPSGTASPPPLAPAPPPPRPRPSCPASSPPPAPAPPPPGPVPSSLEVEPAPASGLRASGAPRPGSSLSVLPSSPVSRVTTAGEGGRAAGSLSPALGTAPRRRGGRCSDSKRQLGGPPAAEPMVLSLTSFYRPGKVRRRRAAFSGSPALGGAESTQDP